MKDDWDRSRGRAKERRSRSRNCMSPASKTKTTARTQYGEYKFEAQSKPARQARLSCRAANLRSRTRRLRASLREDEVRRERVGRSPSQVVCGRRVADLFPSRSHIFAVAHHLLASFTAPHSYSSSFTCRPSPTFWPLPPSAPHLATSRFIDV